MEPSSGLFQELNGSTCLGDMQQWSLMVRLSQPLDELDLDKRFYVQLYHFLATGIFKGSLYIHWLGFGNWNTLEGKNVLEVGSGGAGGLNYIARYLNPDKCIGVDDCPQQVKFSKRSFGENSKNAIPLDCKMFMIFRILTRPKG